MKALILAAGYATRLYPLTEHQPKSLLEVGGKPIIEHIMEKIRLVLNINEVFIVTNHRFFPHFQEWLNSHSPTSPQIKLINDGSKSNEDRLGAVGDLHFVLNRYHLKDDLLVIAGDNLFGFSIAHFINYFNLKNKSLVAFHDLKDTEKVKGKYGVGILNGSKVLDFREKPLEPRSSLASTACYIFTKEDLQLVGESIKIGKADNPGDLVKYLVQKSEVHGFVFDEYWFDVGSFESLQAAEAQLSLEKGIT